MRRALCGWLLPWLSIACSVTPPTTRIFCHEDGDCAADESCVSDLTLGSSYCARTGCTADRDCPKHQRCQLGLAALHSSEELSVCVERVRVCEDVERCNGLDDDCDGAIDGPACQPVVGCLDDRPCGAFVCQAPPNQPAALCLAPNEAAPVADYAQCTAASDCRNGDCATGVCAPFCRPAVDFSTCPDGYTCARAVGAGVTPAHNSCQARCRTPDECSAGLSCVWRDVYEGGDDHRFVCSIPGPGRSALGAACPGSSPADDDTCGSGLCLCKVCTRPCLPGDDCHDVAPDATCVLQVLRYGTMTHQGYICMVPAARCGG